MRYQPGEIIPFIGISFKYANGNIGSLGLGFYRPGDHELLSMQVQLLKCAEHHKVPSYWDTEDKLTCDGFIFVDVSDDEVRWTNQYPRSHGSQTSDAASYNVEMDNPPAGAKKRPRMFDAKVYMERLYAGVQEMEKVGHPWRSQMSAHYEAVVKALADIGVATKVESFELDGEVHDNMYEVTFTINPVPVAA